MREILKYCGNIPLEHVAGGTVLLEEGKITGRVYILAEGRIEVLRGKTQIAVLEEPGSLVGEMSVLLGLPHTASVKTTSPSTIYEIKDATENKKSINFFILWLF